MSGRTHRRPTLGGGPTSTSFFPGASPRDENSSARDALAANPQTASGTPLLQGMFGLPDVTPAREAGDEERTANPLEDLLPSWARPDPDEERRADPVRDTIPHLHVILEQLARCAYDKRDPSNDQVLSRQYGLAGIGYYQVDTISDPATGLQVVLYAPLRDRAPLAGEAEIPGLGDEPLPTVVAFRGSDFGGDDQWLDVLEDANAAGVGTYQFSLHEAEIRALFLEANGMGFGKPFSIGHSLGGAQAQIAAARMGELIAEVVTFQSPGINAAEAAQVDPRQIRSTHHRVTGDAVPVAGERLTQGTVYEHTADKGGLTNFAGHVDLPLASLNEDRKDEGSQYVPGLESLFPQGADRPHFTARMREGHDRTVGGGALEPGRQAIGAMPTEQMAAAANAWAEIRGEIPGWVDAGESPRDVGKRVRAHLEGVVVRRVGVPYVAMQRVMLDPDAIRRLVAQAEMLAEQHARQPHMGRSGGW